MENEFIKFQASNNDIKTSGNIGQLTSWGRGIDKMNKARIADGLQSPVYQTISDSVILTFEGHKPEEFIDKKTGTQKYWKNIGGEKTENDTVKLENDTVKDIFERVNIKNERVKNELMQIYSFIEKNPLVKVIAKV